MNRDTQNYCGRSFTSILRQRIPPPSEYGRSDDREPAGDSSTSGHLFPDGGAQCVSLHPLPLTLRVLEAIPPWPDVAMQAGEARSHTSGQNSQKTCLRTTGDSVEVVSRNTVMEAAIRERVKRTDTRALGNRANGTPHACNGRGVAVARGRQPELALADARLKCENCGKNDRYVWTTWCEPCIWAFVKES